MIVQSYLAFEEQVAGKYIFSKVTQPLNMLPIFIEVVLAGAGNPSNLTHSKLTQSLNTEDKSVQLGKEPNVIVFNDEHPLKVPFRVVIFVKSFGKTTLVILAHP